MRRQMTYMLLVTAVPVLLTAILYGPDVIRSKNAKERAAQNLASLEAEWQQLTIAVDTATDLEARAGYQRFEAPLMSDISRAADIWQYHDQRFREASAMFWRLPAAFLAVAMLVWGCVSWLERHVGPEWRGEVAEIVKEELRELGPGQHSSQPPHGGFLTGR